MVKRIVFFIIISCLGTLSAMEGEIMVEKEFVSAQQLLEDSFRLGKTVLDDGFRPTLLIALWRGGAPIGITITEYFEMMKHPIAKHISVRTSAYVHAKLKDNVVVEGLESVVKNIKSDDKLLIVDDIFDTGSSVAKLLEEMETQCKDNMPGEVKIATIYHKPKNAKPEAPDLDYCLYKTDKWVVFPHELAGLSKDEIIKSKGEKIAAILTP